MKHNKSTIDIQRGAIEINLPAVWTGDQSLGTGVEHMILHEGSCNFSPTLIQTI